MPLEEDTCILILNGDRTTKVEREFIKELPGMAVRLDREREAGTPFSLKELSKEHPVRKFARAVNPKFDE